MAQDNRTGQEVPVSTRNPNTKAHAISVSGHIRWVAKKITGFLSPRTNAIILWTTNLEM